MLGWAQPAHAHSAASSTETVTIRGHKLSADQLRESTSWLRTNSASMSRTKERSALIAALSFISGCYFFGAGLVEAATFLAAAFPSIWTD